ncbi:hypothetical protein F5B22DRAFT_647870 [Xylaria bambusicola]|uniref:uncharacterized protein n=1 Tax=Xylaria bambusicola TaxID=326684 RepID=UPI0020089093|nr:uncharacterized protein F5B22DRAFT_647870 [Xylaria bambusicola]KAI0513320.1 hypothetical protein F5B22DRAFT_647870 [Xylaria bambusicola]
MECSESEDNAPLVHPLGDNLYRVTVSRQNRINFFSEAVRRLNDNSDEAELILRNLQTWSPELASFVGLRTPELIYKVPFRLICESDTGGVPFDEESVLRQYLAVSYCWRSEGGDDTWLGPKMPVHEPWPISRPFVDAILGQRGVVTPDPNLQNVNFRREGIWIDQMCIPQDNPEEKARSIAMMDIIYKCCRKLLIVLEDVVLYPDEIQIFERYEPYLQRTSHDQEAWKPLPDEKLRISRIVDKIETSRWWTRSWCWHEFEINEPWSDFRAHPYIHGAVMIVANCEGGTFTFKLAAFFNIRASSDLYTDGDTLDRSRRVYRWLLMANTLSPYLDPARREEGVERSSIMARFNAASICQCRRLEDLISITMNVSGLALFFSARLALKSKIEDVGVADPSDALFFVSALCLAAGEKTPLTSMSGEMLQLSEKNGTFSWLSNEVAQPDPVARRFTIGGIKYIHGLSPYHIKLDLVFFDTPIVNTSEEELQLTCEFLPEYPIVSARVEYKPQYKDKYQNPWGPSAERDEKLDTSRRNLLVNSCSCGLEYICHLWEAVEKQFLQTSFDDNLAEPFTPDASHRDTAKKLLEHISPAESTNIRYLDILIKLISFIKDPRSARVMSPWMARIRCNNDVGAAIIHSPTIRQGYPFISTRARLAIPRDLLDMPWTANRVWILEPWGIPQGEGPKNHAGLSESPGEVWKIVGKAQCLGDVLAPVSRNSENNVPESMSLRTATCVGEI